MKDTPTTCPLKLALPPPAEKLLLHVCCAPCSCAIIEALHQARINFSLYFYNPNIHPREEYDLRKKEVMRFAIKLNIPFIDADYDVDTWKSRTRGLENEPERGARCAACFDLRLERTAQFAAENHFPLIATSLGISRWKNLDQINEAGHKAAQHQTGVSFWDINWRKEGRQARGTFLAKEEAFHQQIYCGCVHSLENTNKRLAEQGQPPIKPGEKRIIK